MKFKCILADLIYDLELLGVKEITLCLVGLGATVADALQNKGIIVDGYIK